MANLNRLVVGILSLDAWYAILHHSKPVIHVDVQQIPAPCDDELFEAPSADEWFVRCQTGRYTKTPAGNLSGNGTAASLPALYEPKSQYHRLALLCGIQVHLCHALHGMVYGSDDDSLSSRTIPGDILKRNVGSAWLAPALVSLANESDYGLDDANSSCAVLWHHMCIMLTTDLEILTLAAGCEGVGPAHGALEACCAWSKTAAARRACVHAGQILRLVSRQRTSQLNELHSITALISAALVMCMYVFTLAPEVSDRPQPYEIMGPVNWITMGDVALATPSNDGRASSSPNHPDDPTYTFVKCGGSLSISGTSYPLGGTEPARQVLQDFIIALKSMKPWTLHEFSRVFESMSDVMLD